MHSLVEFMVVTKGIEYLIAVAFLFAFIAFWHFVTSVPAPQYERVGVVEMARRIGERIGGFLLPEGLFFHPGHTWAKVDAGDVVTVGIDDFAQKLVGRVNSVQLPQVGSTIRQGERGLSLQVDAKTIPMLSPVDGKVVAVNKDILKSPEGINKDSYDKGWLMKVHAPRIAANLKNLLSGRLAKRWIEEARGQLSSHMNDYNLGLVLQDGGVLVDGIAKNLAPERWDEVAKEFFLTTEE
ncbi:MAG: glycine cleavage system protein H [Deltaproteobacteria bacterium]|nr:glycine cleavage system protein H [Deltaproteobacteria bacterium]